MFTEDIMFKRPPKVPYVFHLWINPFLTKVEAPILSDDGVYITFKAFFSKRSYTECRRFCFSLKEKPKLKFSYTLVGKFFLDGQRIFALLEQK